MEKFNVKHVLDITGRNFWSFVECDLSGLDDDWLLTGMELGLINDAALNGINVRTVGVVLTAVFDEINPKLSRIT